MLTTVMILYLAALALPALGAFRGWQRARRNYRKALSDYAAAVRISRQHSEREREIASAHRSHEISEDERQSQRRQLRSETKAKYRRIGVTQATYGSMDVIEYRLPAILMRAIAEGQGWNAGFIIAGLVSSAAAGLLSLTLVQV